jgi:hypothetical protein
VSQPGNIDWVLIATGLATAGLGLLLVLSPSLPWLGRLPGDIRVQRGNFRFYFPLVTCLLLSLAVSLVLLLVRFFRR